MIDRFKTIWIDKFKIGEDYLFNTYTYLCLAFSTTGFPVFEKDNIVFQVSDYDILSKLVHKPETIIQKWYIGIYLATDQLHCGLPGKQKEKVKEIIGYKLLEIKEIEATYIKD